MWWQAKWISTGEKEVRRLTQLSAPQSSFAASGIGASFVVFVLSDAQLKIDCST